MLLMDISVSAGMTNPFQKALDKITTQIQMRSEQSERSERSERSEQPSCEHGWQINSDLRREECRNPIIGPCSRRNICDGSYDCV